jgi:hypothetical protein
MNSVASGVVSVTKTAGPFVAFLIVVRFDAPETTLYKDFKVSISIPRTIH